MFEEKIAGLSEKGSELVSSEKSPPRSIILKDWIDGTDTEAKGRRRTLMEVGNEVVDEASRNFFATAYIFLVVSFALLSEFSFSSAAVSGRRENY